MWGPSKNDSLLLDEIDYYSKFYLKYKNSFPVMALRAKQKKNELFNQLFIKENVVRETLV
tara:strand:- start:45 stop:224 length:180 start_codon:yes stop_codon:yes gene_type:complete